jgi:acrylyl-CoA reductase (NADPH)
MRAFVAEKGDDGVTRGVRDDLDTGDLGEGDVLVKVAWSSVNYKDALATIAKGQVARISPLIPGIDLAGTDEDSGEDVLAHGYELGVSHHGGYAEYARVPSDWIVPLPDGLSAKQAMAIGTAGYTAARCIMALEAAGLRPDSGAVLVTGASGGVGSTAVDILAARGYEVVASTGKDPEFLESLGAAEVFSRVEAAGDASRPMERSRWAARCWPERSARCATAA